MNAVRAITLVATAAGFLFATWYGAKHVRLGIRNALVGIGAVIGAGVLFGLANAWYLASGSDVFFETFTFVVGLGMIACAVAGWQDGEEERKRRRRRHPIAALAIVTVLAVGTSTFVIEREEPAPTVQLDETNAQPVGYSDLIQRSKCGLFEFLSPEYLLFNMTFGCSILFKPAGTAWLASGYYATYVANVLPAPLNLIVRLNLQRLVAYAGFCKYFGRTLWATWRSDSVWYITLGGVLPEAHCL